MKRNFKVLKVFLATKLYAFKFFLVFKKLATELVKLIFSLHFFEFTFC